MSIALVALAACGPRGPEPTEADFDLAGTWAVIEEEVASDTTIAFAEDGTWSLLEPGGRCDDLLFRPWFCDGQGTWTLVPDALLADEDTNLTIVRDGDGYRRDLEAWFDGDPDHFCWKQTSNLRTECIVRQ